jgi:hypothetical protein
LWYGLPYQPTKVVRSEPYQPYRVLRQWVGLPSNSCKPITNMAWVHAQLCKLQIRVHSTHSHKWWSLPVVCSWSVVISGYSGFFQR